MDTFELIFISQKVLFHTEVPVNEGNLCFFLASSFVSFFLLWCKWKKYLQIFNPSEYRRHQRSYIYSVFRTQYSVNIYLFEVNNKNIRKTYDICSKLTIRTLEWRYRRRSGVSTYFIEHISQLFVFLLSTLNK